MFCFDGPYNHIHCKNSILVYVIVIDDLITRYFSIIPCSGVKFDEFYSRRFIVIHMSFIYVYYYAYTQ